MADAVNDDVQRDGATFEDDCPLEEPPETMSVHLQGEWQSDLDGVSETRWLVGKSPEGFHAGLEVSHQGGDCEPRWSPAYGTSEKAQREAIELDNKWHLDNRDCAQEAPETRSVGLKPVADNQPEMNTQPNQWLPSGEVDRCATTIREVARHEDTEFRALRTETQHLLAGDEPRVVGGETVRMTAQRERIQAEMILGKMVRTELPRSAHKLALPSSLSPEECVTACRERLEKAHKAWASFRDQADPALQVGARLGYGPGADALAAFRDARARTQAACKELALSNEIERRHGR